jgi:hypothetical protein
MRPAGPTPFSGSEPTQNVLMVCEETRAQESGEGLRRRGDCGVFRHDRAPVCSENVIRFDSVTDWVGVGGDDRPQPMRPQEYDEMVEQRSSNRAHEFIAPWPR